VNKSLEKAPYTEQQLLDHLVRLGARGRSPIWTPDDFAESDWKARIQGLVVGGLLVGIGVGVIYAIR